MTTSTSRRWLTLLVALLVVDFVLIWVSLTFVDTPTRRYGTIVRLGAYDSLASILLYLKWLIGAWWLLAASYRTRSCWILAIGVVFVALFIDDFAEIHDHVGAWIGENLSFTVLYGLKAETYGEMIFHVAFAVVVFGLLAMSYRYAPAHARRWPLICALLIVALAVSGVGLDALHTSAKLDENAFLQGIDILLGVLEDGGELVWGSALLVLAYVISRLDRTPAD